MAEQREHTVPISWDYQTIFTSLSFDTFHVYLFQEEQRSYATRQHYGFVLPSAAPLMTESDFSSIAMQITN
ncbi:hypothetical protein [Pedosphaera parvula]|uniref:Uncharacterized protein n=1 Tax=Pedosphaera parvula (strain Ellin514) TaxID=320771 RepID=B9XHL8_PEDPL|nr:hypothetical protein [Pedosphaera parvula]EEF60596.1 hypothetical protein Cflav_PD6186 [Pedosphaera parvula Ellin514]